MTDVGTNKVFENDEVVLWEFFLEPGEQTEDHTHVLDFISYVIDGSTLQVRGPGGVEIANVEVPTGDVIAFRVEDEELVSSGHAEIRIPATHSACNVGQNRYREVFIEFKR